MIYKSIELGKEYKSQEEFFRDVKANMKKIIDFKKSVIYKSYEKGQLGFGDVIAGDAEKGISAKDGYIHPVINTTNFVDSHLDNHQKGIWNKTIKEKQGKIRYSLDHSHKIADVIAYPEDVHMKTVTTTFRELGYDSDKETQALVFDIKEDVIDNEVALKVIRKRKPVQNSVSMQYVKLSLAINSTEKEYREEKKNWDESIDEVANKEEVEEIGLMWLVKEAKIMNESSMVTLGSNPVTPIIYNDENKSEEPPKDTPKEEPSKDTLSKENQAYLEALKSFIN